jgi:hypothetical protein
MIPDGYRQEVARFKASISCLWDTASHTRGWSSVIARASDFCSKIRRLTKGTHEEQRVHARKSSYRTKYMTSSTHGEADPRHFSQGRPVAEPPRRVRVELNCWRFPRFAKRAVQRQRTIQRLSNGRTRENLNLNTTKNVRGVSRYVPT